MTIETPTGKTDPLAASNDPRTALVQEKLASGIISDTDLRTIRFPLQITKPKVDNALIDQSTVATSTAKKVSTNLVKTLKAWGMEGLDELQREFMTAFDGANLSELRKFINDVLCPYANLGI